MLGNIKNVITAIDYIENHLTGSWHLMTGSIDFLGAHPQYRKRGITKVFCEKVLHELTHSEIITVTTHSVLCCVKRKWGYRHE